LNYSRHYFLLISRAQDRSLPPDTHTEKHHIVPVSMDGDNTKSNLVHLTPEEHFVSHQLLARMFPRDSRLKLAVAMMSTMGCHSTGVGTNKTYGTFRREHRALLKCKPGRIQTAEEKAKRIRTMTGRGPRSEETKAKISQAKVGRKQSDETRAKKSASATARWAAHRVNSVFHIHPDLANKA
jgi:hypothetical protein